MENGLDDLYSVVQFVDDRRLGPGFCFFNKHWLLVCRMCADSTFLVNKEKPLTSSSD